MTCLIIQCVAYVPEPGPVWWLASDFRAGPRSPRIHSRSEEVSGPVISTETSWMPDGSQATGLQRAFHMKHLAARRDALASTLAKLRREHRATCLVMAELRAVTNAILAMGWR